MGRRVTVILNPASGRGRARASKGRLRALLTEAATDTDGCFEIVETTARGEAVSTGRLVVGGGGCLAREAAQSGADVVAAAGGDGSLAEVLNGIVGTQAKLGILPLGTGNDFARALGCHKDLKLAVRALFEGEPRAVDVGRRTVENPEGGWFMNVVGSGFDGMVAERINSGYRHVHGTSAYVLGVLQTLARFTPSPMRITVDGDAMERTVMLCAVANSTSYGGGMKVAPEARIDDGFFDIVIVEKMSKLEFVRSFARVFRGTHVNHPKVTTLRGKEVLLEADPPLPVLVDGEDAGKTPIRLWVEPGMIQVMTPPS